MCAQDCWHHPPAGRPPLGLPPLGETLSPAHRVLLSAGHPLRWAPPTTAACSAPRPQGPVTPADLPAARSTPSPQLEEARGCSAQTREAGSPAIVGRGCLHPGTRKQKNKFPASRSQAARPRTAGPAPVGPLGVIAAPGLRRLPTGCRVGSPQLLTPRRRLKAAQERARGRTWQAGVAQLPRGRLWSGPHTCQGRPLAGPRRELRWREPRAPSGSPPGPLVPVPRAPPPHGWRSRLWESLLWNLEDLGFGADFSEAAPKTRP